MVSVSGQCSVWKAGVSWEILVGVVVCSRVADYKIVVTPTIHRITATLTNLGIHTTVKGVWHDYRQRESGGRRWAEEWERRGGTRVREGGRVGERERGEGEQLYNNMYSLLIVDLVYSVFGLSGHWVRTLLDESIPLVRWQRHSLQVTITLQ